MNKELGRKITSLTLMTIMLTWTAAMGFSSTFMPEAEAENQYLYVSAESAGSIAGAQVIEVVVAEPSISELDTAYGMPDVSINGSSIVMAQAVDGAWYAYVVDATASQLVDSYYTANEVGTSAGGDFGRMCGNGSDNAGTDLSYKNDGAAIPGTLTAIETQGVWTPFQTSDSAQRSDGSSTYTQGSSITACSFTAADHTNGVTSGVNATTNMMMNVVREAPALSNQTTANEYGNIQLGANLWPLIQMLDFSSDGNIDIVYNRAGADETVTLIYSDGAEGLSFDKDVYGLKHEVGMTLTDWNMNIDPTDEDSWTFGTLPSNATVFYQLYDENGTADGAAQTLTPAQNNAVKFDSATAGDITPGGVLTIDRNGNTNDSSATTDAVINFQLNADVEGYSLPSQTCDDGLCETRNIAEADQAITMTEAGANTGVFVNWDESLTTNMVIADAAPRGTQAVFVYDGSSYGVMNNPQFGTVEFDTSDIGSEWNSGEPVTVRIFDPDMNLDARSADDLVVKSNSTIVPAIKVGSPITLATLSKLVSDTQQSGTLTLDDQLELPMLK